MIRQDYLIRMIQETTSLIASMVLNKERFHKDERIEYDCLIRQILGLPQEQLWSMNSDELINHHEGDPNRMGKAELAVMTLLKISNEIKFNIL